MVNTLTPRYAAAGHLPQPTGGDLIVGKIGKDLTPEQGYDAAHHVALSLIATLKRECSQPNRCLWLLAS